jgi:hypothetical protein
MLIAAHFRLVRPLDGAKIHACVNRNHAKLSVNRR